MGDRKSDTKAARIARDPTTATATRNSVASKSKAAGNRFKTTFRNTIYDTLLRRGWKETSDSDWDFYWADREYIYDLLDTVHLENGQRVNHFRNGRELCRKDLLIKNLKRAKRQTEKKAKYASLGNCCCGWLPHSVFVT